jgi:bla regulator protein blaR1
MDTFAIWMDTLFVRLAWTTAQATLLIGALWLLGRCMPRLAPAMRCMLWWLVAAQLLLGMVVSNPVPLRWLKPAMESAPAKSIVIDTATSAATLSDAPFVQALPANHASSAFDLFVSAWSWRESVLTVWLLIIAAQLYFVIREWRQSRKLLGGATTVPDAHLRYLCAQQARALGLHRHPELRLSDAITSPQVTGLWRPVVLFPAAHALSDDETAMALAHELAHIRRGDLWLGWVPAIAQRLFFFHPLVHWAMREYALNREAACDAHVLKQPQLEPRDYGRLLLRLGVSSPMHSSLAGASPTFANLKRRMLMLQQTSTMPARARGWIWVAAVALIGILPYRLTSADPIQSAAAPATASSAPATMEVPPVSQAARPVAPLPPLPPRAAPAGLSAPPPPPPPPAPAAPEQSARMSGNSYHYVANHIDGDINATAKNGIVLFDGDLLLINGSDADSQDAYRYYKPPVPMLWYRNGDKAYVIRDSNLIQQARDTYSALTDVAREQGELAGREGAISGEMAGLGAREAALAERQSNMEVRRATLEMKLEALRDRQASSDNTADTLSIKGQLKGIDAEAAEITREYADIHHQQTALSQRQQALTQEQHALSAKQKEQSATVDARMSKLLDDAKARGIAEPVSR